MRRALLLGALLLAGCGQAVDFSGDADVPEGYETYSGQGLSFAHPKLPQKADDDRITFGDEKDFVELRVAAGEAATERDFRIYLDGYVTLARHAGDSEVEVTEQEVPKADAARLLEVTGPQGLESRVLVVDRGDDVILLSAGKRSGSAGKVDADAVISSFRLR